MNFYRIIRFIFVNVQKHFLHLYITLFFLESVSAQDLKKEDTLNYFIANHDLFAPFDSVVFSNLDGFQFYRGFGKRRLPIADNGNLGLPVHSLLSQTQNWNHNHVIGAYQPFILSGDSMKFYQVSNPLTIFNYANGGEREQYFTVFHTQNIGEGLNISFRYDKINSEGFFIRQQTNHSRFNSTYHLQNRNKKLQSRGFYTINTIEAFENGGVFISEEGGGESTAILLDINMFDAQNRSRSREVETLNSYGWGLNKDGERKVSLFHRINWTKSSRNFDNITQSSNGYYSNFYLDTASTFDTMSVLKFSNQFGIGIVDRLHAYYEIVEYNYFQNFITNEDLFTNNIGLKYQDTIFDYGITATLKKGLNGYYEDNLKLELRTVSKEFKGFRHSLNVLFNRSAADYFYTRQRANNYYYDIELESSNTSRINIALSKEKWNSKLQLSYENYSNYIYYDSLVLPSQYAEDIQVIKIQAQKSFHFFRNIHSVNKLLYQFISDDEVIPLPNWIGYHSLYYENKLFKNSLKVQIGFDYSWTNSYQGYAYDPAMAQYHFRNNNELLSGINQLDLFLNLKIAKSARLFFKYENVLFPSYDPGSLRVENYPIPGRVMKVGLSWRMIN